MIRGIHHTGISTPDLDRSLRFYQDLIGLEVLSEGSWDEGFDTGDRIIGLENTAAKWVMLSAGNSNLELFEFVSPPGATQDPDRPASDHGISHLCFEVADIQALYERFRAAGVRFHCPPQNLEEMGTVTYARDPDGNIVELIEYSGESGESLNV
jgi:glyoxylase I family protein